MITTQLCRNYGLVSQIYDVYRNYDLLNPNT